MNFFKCVLVILVAAALQGCMLAGKMTRIVSEHYVKKGSLKQIDNSDWLTVNSDKLPKINGFCNTRYKRFFTIPLLVYTYSDEMIECKVNPKMYVNSIITEINKLTQSGINSSKIIGKKVELAIYSIPVTFHHHYNNHFIAVQFLFQNVTLSFTKNELYNKASAIEIQYTIRDKETLTVIKSGTLSSSVQSQYYIKNYSQRRKIFVQDYLYSFDNNIENSCRQIATDLFNQL